MRTVLVLAFALSCAVSSAQDVPTLMETGKNQYRSNDYAAAVETFNTVLSVDTSQLNAHIGLGRSLEKLKRWEDAARAYEAATVAFPERADFHYRLGIVYRNLEDFDQSINAYLEFQKLDPESPDSYYGLGESYRRAGQLEAARSAFETYVQRETRPDEQDYVNRAQEMIAAIDAELAEQSAAEVEDAMAEEAAVLPGDTGSDGGKTEAPEVELAEKPTVSPEASAPENLDMDALRGRIGDFASAEEALARGDALFSEADYPQAAAAYEAAYALDPASIPATYKLGVALAVAGDTGAAIDAWEITLDIEPGFALARDNIERAKRRLAVDAVLDSPKLYGDAEERSALTTRYLDAGRYVMALRSAEALLDIAPADPQTHRMLARAHLGIGHPAEALEALKNEMSLQPGDFGLYKLMGEAHGQLDELEQSAYYYQLFLDSTDPDGSDPSKDEIRARVERLREAISAAPEAEAETSTSEADSEEPATVIPDDAQPSGDGSEESRPNTLVP